MSSKEILTRVLALLSPYGYQLSMAMLAMLFVALFTGAQTYMVKDLLDKNAIERNESVIVSMIAGTPAVGG
jgi:ABC-type multidrug transport system fused ATPase/permease subunit